MQTIIFYIKNMLSQMMMKTNLHYQNTFQQFLREVQEVTSQPVKNQTEQIRDILDQRHERPSNIVYFTFTLLFCLCYFEFFCCRRRVSTAKSNQNAKQLSAADQVAVPEDFAVQSALTNAIQNMENNWEE